MWLILFILIDNNNEVIGGAIGGVLGGLLVVVAIFVLIIISIRKR